MNKDKLTNILNEYTTSLETILNDVESWDKTFPSINIIKKIRPHILKTKSLIADLISVEIPQLDNRIKTSEDSIKELQEAVHKINNRLNNFAMLETLLQRQSEESQNEVNE